MPRHQQRDTAAEEAPRARCAYCGAPAAWVVTTLFADLHVGVQGDSPTRTDGSCDVHVDQVTTDVQRLFLNGLPALRSSVMRAGKGG